MSYKSKDIALDHDTPLIGVLRLGVIALMVIGLTACAGMNERLNAVGKEPVMSAIEDPVETGAHRSVSMPMPEAKMVSYQPNSLWSGNKRSFFKDQRASAVGDILTVLIDMKDSAKLENKTERTRDSSEDFDFNALFGLESQITKILPEGTDGTDIVNMGASSTTGGDGSIERDEEIDLKVAATVVQTLPNGNMVIHGKQEIRVNFEMRELQVAGIIRPEDVLTDNTISYDKIAEARISYGGVGQISDLQQPRYGTQVLDILMPF